MANEQRNLKIMSRQEWNGDKGYDAINCGSLQRIADATEKMAANYTALQQNYDSVKNNRDYWQRQYEKEKRRAAALRGIINRLKKKS